ncbi:MAG: hypothetical protein U1F98_05700 [Verrucomicrobiota bacterium]
MRDEAQDFKQLLEAIRKVQRDAQLSLLQAILSYSNDERRDTRLYYAALAFGVEPNFCPFDETVEMQKSSMDKAQIRFEDKLDSKSLSQALSAIEKLKQY